jgi:hypothetical protein
LIDDAERLDAALNRRRIGASLDDVAPPLRELVELAMEVGDACASAVLTSAERDRIYADVLDRLGAVHARLLWRRLTGRQAALLGGAAAVTAVAAAIGLRVVVGRRGHRVHLAPV